MPAMTRVAGHIYGAARKVGVEHLAQLVCRLETIRRVFFHALEDDSLKIAVDIGVDLARRYGKLVDLLEGDGDGIVAVKGNAACGALVHHHAERIDIGGGGRAPGRALCSGLT